MKTKGSDTGLEFSSGLGLNQSCLRAFAAMAKTLGQSLPMDMILTATLDLTLADAGVEAGEIYLLDEKGGELIYACHRGLSEDCVQEARWVPVKLGEGVTGRVAALKEPIVVPKLSEKDQFCRESPRREGYRSLISLPIKSGDRVYGVINLFSRNDRRLSPRYVQWLADSMELLGVALEDVQPFDGNNIRMKGLEEAEERYRRLVEDINDGYAVIQDWRLVFVNAKLAQMLGYQKEELVGAHYTRLVTQERIADTDELRQTIARGSPLPERYETLAARKDGTKVALEVSMKAFTYEGKPAASVIVRDITERKQAEEALTQAVAHWYDTFNAIEDLVMIVDKDHQVVQANQATHQAFTGATVIGAHCYELLHGTEEPIPNCPSFRAFSTGEATHHEMCEPHLGGRWFDVFSYPIKGEDGAVQQVVHVARDISERKRAEEALRRSEEHFRSLIENISDIIAVVNSDGTIGYASPSIEWVIGYEPEELTGRSPFDFIHPDDLQNVANIFAELIQNRSSAPSAEIRIRQKDGSWRFVEAKYKSILNDSGTASTVINARDITERKRAEQALTQSAAHWHDTFDAIEDLVMIVDKDHQVVQANQATHKAFTGATVIGAHCYEQLHGTEEPIPNCPSYRAFSTGEATHHEVCEPHLGGRWFDVFAYPIKGEDGAVQQVVHVARDITERKRADEALRQRTEELEKAYEELKAMHDFMIKSARLRALGEMASGVAHDFNNILSIIIGRAQLALEDTKDPGVVNALQIIEETGLDGAQTVRRLQDFARVRVDHDFDSVDLNAIVKSAVQMVEPRRAERQETGTVVIDIYTELEKLAPVNGNPSELKEAMVNILFNAMDAMPDGGKITIKTMVENDRVVVSISDTGAGMTDEIKSKIFDPFFSTKGHHGLGMGLSVTYGIIARHKGIIDVDSVPGKGTSFHIKLPAATRTKKKARNSSITPSVDGANILLVDDSPQVSEVLKLILNQMGHYVTEVNNGKEAISTFEKGDYTLVITDLGMPDMSGREVARAIKERKPKTPVILITGWGVQLDPEEMRKVGIDGVVPKPLSREALSVQIAGLLPSSSRE